MTRPPLAVSTLLDSHTRVFLSRTGAPSGAQMPASRDEWCGHLGLSTGGTSLVGRRAASRPHDVQNGSEMTGIHRRPMSVRTASRAPMGELCWLYGSEG